MPPSCCVEGFGALQGKPVLLPGGLEGTAVSSQPEHHSVSSQRSQATGWEPSMNMGRLGGPTMVTDFPAPCLALGLSALWLLKVSSGYAFPTSTGRRSLSEVRFTEPPPDSYTANTMETPTIVHNPRGCVSPTLFHSRGSTPPSLQSSLPPVRTECLQFLSSDLLIKGPLADKCLAFPWEIICFQSQTSACCSISWLSPCQWK